MVPYKWMTIFALVTLVLAVSRELATPRILGLIIDEGIEPLAEGEDTMGQVAAYTGIMIAVSIAGWFINYAHGWSRHWVGFKMVRDLRRDLFERLQQHSPAFYAEMSTGEAMSRLTGDVDSIIQFFSWGGYEMFWALASFIFTVILFLATDWQLALAVLSPMLFLILVVVRFSTRIGPAWKKVRDQFGRLTSTLQESISGVRVVKAFAQEEGEIKKFGSQNLRLRYTVLGRANVESTAYPLMDFFTAAGFAILFTMGGRMVIAGEMSLGTLLSLQWYLWQIIWPIRFLGQVIGMLRQALASAPRLFEILDTPLHIKNKPEAKEIGPVEGCVKFEDVRFAFPDAPERSILKGFNLEVQPGETVAILGGTGSGKSSVINLLMRFHDVTGGRVLVDGQDVRDVTLESLRAKMAVVFQETFLFSASIRDNISYGAPNATMEDVERAAKVAQAHDFISKMEKGYKTVVGERGVGLSGGQKQRVALARAVIKNPAILILDEATSSVDTETEYEIQMALSNVLANRTGIVIAQRLSTIQNADRIIVLKDGVVVEEGTHDELLAEDGEYARIYELQFSKEAAEEAKQAAAAMTE